MVKLKRINEFRIGDVKLTKLHLVKSRIGKNCSKTWEQGFLANGCRGLEQKVFASLGRNVDCGKISKYSLRLVKF